MFGFDFQTARSFNFQTRERVIKKIQNSKNRSRGQPSNKFPLLIIGITNLYKTKTRGCGKVDYCNMSVKREINITRQMESRESLVFISEKR